MPELPRSRTGPGIRRRGRPAGLVAIGCELAGGRGVVAHYVPHHEKYREQDYDDEKAAEQLPVAQHQFEFATLIVLHGLAGLDGSPILLRARSKEDSISSGRGNTMVVFFSVPISTSVCR